VDALISFDPPEAGLTVQLLQVLEAIDPQPSEYPEGSFNSSLLIGPVRIAKMDRKTEVAGKVQELGVKLQFRASLNDDGFDVVIPVSAGHAAHFSIGFDMALQEKLQTLPDKTGGRGIGVGQDHGKSIRRPQGTVARSNRLELPPREETSVHGRRPVLVAVLLGVESNHGITALILIGLQALVDLGGFRKGNSWYHWSISRS